MRLKFLGLLWKLQDRARERYASVMLSPTTKASLKYLLIIVYVGWYVQYSIEPPRPVLRRLPVECQFIWRTLRALTKLDVMSTYVCSEDKQISDVVY